ncbi:MAG: phage shock protein A [Planctomycetota bacterium]|jgi:phage shock protein A
MSKGTLDRIAAIWRSNVNEVLDHLEDPEKLVPQLVRDMEDAVDRAVASLGRAMANEKRLQKEQAKNVEQIAECQEKAEIAIEKDDERAARLYIEKKAQLGRTHEALEPALAESSEAATQLRSQLEELRSRLQEAKNRQQVLIERIRAGRRSGGGTESGDVGSEGEAYVRFAEIERQVRDHERDFSRFEEKAMVAEAEAELQREMGESERNDRELKRIEAEHRVETELAALRAKVQKDA